MRALFLYFLIMCIAEYVYCAEGFSRNSSAPISVQLAKQPASSFLPLLLTSKFYQAEDQDTLQSFKDEYPSAYKASADCPVADLDKYVLGLLKKAENRVKKISVPLFGEVNVNMSTDYINCFDYIKSAKPFNGLVRVSKSFNQFFSLSVCDYKNGFYMNSVFPPLLNTLYYKFSWPFAFGQAVHWSQLQWLVSQVVKLEGLEAVDELKKLQVCIENQNEDTEEESGYLWRASLNYDGCLNNFTEQKCYFLDKIVCQTSKIGSYQLDPLMLLLYLMLFAENYGHRNADDDFRIIKDAFPEFPFQDDWNIKTVSPDFNRYKDYFQKLISDLSEQIKNVDRLKPHDERGAREYQAFVSSKTNDLIEAIKFFESTQANSWSKKREKKIKSSLSLSEYYVTCSCLHYYGFQNDRLVLLRFLKEYYAWINVYTEMRSFISNCLKSTRVLCLPLKTAFAAAYVRWNKPATGIFESPSALRHKVSIETIFEKIIVESDELCVSVVKGLARFGYALDMTTQEKKALQYLFLDQYFYNRYKEKFENFADPMTTVPVLDPKIYGFRCNKWLQKTILEENGVTKDVYFVELKNVFDHRVFPGYFDIKFEKKDGICKFFYSANFGPIEIKDREISSVQRLENENSFVYVRLKKLNDSPNERMVEQVETEKLEVPLNRVVEVGVLKSEESFKQNDLVKTAALKNGFAKVKNNSNSVGEGSKQEIPSIALEAKIDELVGFLSNSMIKAEKIKKDAGRLFGDKSVENLVELPENQLSFINKVKKSLKFSENYILLCGNSILLFFLLIYVTSDFQKI